MQGLQVKLLQFIRRHELLAGGEWAVVGLSGGGDSESTWFPSAPT